MTTTTEPPYWPARPQQRAVVVRWRHPHWTKCPDGLWRWRTRWFVSPNAAHRLARKLRDAGAIVHHDVYKLDFVVRVDDVTNTVHGPDDLVVNDPPDPIDPDQIQDEF